MPGFDRFIAFAPGFITLTPRLSGFRNGLCHCCPSLFIDSSELERMFIREAEELKILSEPPDEQPSRTRPKILPTMWMDSNSSKRTGQIIAHPN
jgi:hypothetical protein